jgi:DNA-binding response OmpR family regulator
MRKFNSGIQDENAGGEPHAAKGRESMRILVVDDEKLLVKGIRFNLENEGYEVECAYDGAAAVEMTRTGRFDLLILDVMMPKVDGIEACMRIREFSNVPVIMLTAKSEDVDKLVGFESGADDYLTKPFNIMELKARVRALLRRAVGARRSEAKTLTAGDIVVNPEERTAEKNGRMVDLTAKEYDLIELLMRNPRRVYSRENLMNVVWGYSYGGDYRTVDVHIRRLREKLETDPAQPEYILTKWGVGYYFKG